MSLADGMIALLRASRDLIADPACWTQGASARDPEGAEIEEPEPGIGFEDAVCWCAVGAVVHAAELMGAPPDVVGRARWELMNTLGAKDSRNGITTWNDADERVHADVIDLFDRAIARAASLLVLEARAEMLRRVRAVVIDGPSIIERSEPTTRSQVLAQVIVYKLQRADELRDQGKVETAEAFESSAEQDLATLRAVVASEGSVRS